MRIQHDRSELHFVTRFVDRLVGLDEHRVALVHVLERRAVVKFQTARAPGRQVVVTRADIADLRKKKL